MSGDRQYVLLHLEVTPDLEAARVVLSVSRSDSGAVLRGFLDVDAAQRVARALYRASWQLETDR